VGRILSYSGGIRFKCWPGRSLSWQYFHVMHSRKHNWIPQKYSTLLLGWQMTRLLVREGAPQGQNSNCHYNLFGFHQSQLYFSNAFYYYYYIPTTCFGPYGPSPGGIYIHWLLPKELFFLQWIQCSCFGYQLCIYIYIYISFLFLRFFRCCQYVCDGYDCLLLLLHFQY
jgi:hypothetical protein